MHGYDPSAWMTAVLITLMFAPLLMWFVPRCDHPECAQAHKDANAKASKAQGSAAERNHMAYHDRLRPQPLCIFCQQAKRDDVDPDE